MESNDLGSLMRFLHDDGEYHKTGLTITETSKKLASTVKVPQQTPVQSKPDVDHEALGVETYEDEDLTKVKSQTPKNKKFAVRKVADKEVETPIPVVKPPTKESKIGTLYLCNECFKTFRNIKAKCLHCSSTSVEPIVQIKEGVLELVGEVPGISVGDQRILQLAINTDVISDKWPSDEEMTDALSSLEDIVDPEQESPDMDLKMSYLKHVLIPKALSMHEGKVTTEGMLPGSNLPDWAQKGIHDAVQSMESGEAEQMNLAWALDIVAGQAPSAEEWKAIRSQVAEELEKFGVMEGKVPSDRDDSEEKIIQKLTEDSDPEEKDWSEKEKAAITEIMHPVSVALENLSLGYYHSSSRRDVDDGSVIFEFVSVVGAPPVEVHIK